MTCKKARLFARSSSPSSLQLTPRDYEALAALSEHRILSADHLRRLVFRAAASKVRRRLRALYDHHLIDRLRVVSAPSQGIPPFFYTLTDEGGTVLGCQEAVRLSHGIRRGSLQFLHHRHLLNEFYVALVEASRHRGFTVAQWQHEEALRLVARDGLPGQPERIRHPELGEVPFLPDAYCELQVSATEQFAYFVELDRATHSQRVWRDRAKLYAAYADPRTGLFRRRFGRETFRLLVITTPDYRRRSRRDNILRTIRETIGPSDLFLATTFDRMAAGRLLDFIWHRTNGGSPCSIVRNPPVVVRARA
jgi:hypothetical protein